MLTFDTERFVQALREAPENTPFLEAADYSEYLQRQVLDKLKGHEPLDLLNLDWDKLPPCRSFIPNYHELYERVDAGWTKGVNLFFRETPAAPLAERSFF